MGFLKKSHPDRRLKRCNLPMSDAASTDEAPDPRGVPTVPSRIPNDQKSTHIRWGEKKYDESTHIMAGAWVGFLLLVGVIYVFYKKRRRSRVAMRAVREREAFAHSHATWLDEKINALPTCTYAAPQSEHRAPAGRSDGGENGLGESGESEGAGATDCAICLSPFEPGDTLSTLPCGHQYRAECIRGWFKSKHALEQFRRRGQLPTCPTCKKIAIPLDGLVEMTTIQSPSPSPAEQTWPSFMAAPGPPAAPVDEAPPEPDSQNARDG